MMGVCCCRQQLRDSQLSEQQTQNAKQEQNNSMDEPTAHNITVYHENDTHELEEPHQEKENTEIDDTLRPFHRTATQHWKTETFQILSLMPADLDSDFEDYDDTQYSPKQLINVPRKSYIKYEQKQITQDTDHLQIGTTLDQTTWRSCSASIFNVRGIQYAMNKKSKLQTSEPALYDVFAVDCFTINSADAMDQNVTEMINCFNFQHTNQLHSNYPNIFIVSLMIPLFKKKERNGVHILIYSKTSKEFEAILQDVHHDTLPCVKLLDQLLNLDADVLNSFKMTLRIPNVKETNLNQISKKLVKTINGKCMAFKKHATFGYLDGNKTHKNVFVVNFNGFSVNKNIIKGLSVAREHLQSMDFEIGFHVGGKRKEILPERILLCTKLMKLNMNQLVSFDTFSANVQEDDVKHKGHTRVDTYVMDEISD